MVRLIRLYLSVKFNSFSVFTYDDATLYVPTEAWEAYTQLVPWRYFKEIREIRDFVAGDADGSDTVDIDDVNILINIMLSKADSDHYPAADANGDGKVDVDDLNFVINTMLGKE